MNDMEEEDDDKKSEEEEMTTGHAIVKREVASPGALSGSAATADEQDLEAKEQARVACHPQDKSKCSKCLVRITTRNLKYRPILPNKVPFENISKLAKKYLFSHIEKSQKYILAFNIPSCNKIVYFIACKKYIKMYFFTQWLNFHVLRY